MPFYSFAQDNLKQKEVGFAMSSFNNFGLTYRLGKAKSLWRISAILVNGGQSSRFIDSLREESFGFGAGFQVGKEFRKNITENFEFRYGIDIGFSFRNSHKLREDDTSRNLDLDITINNYDPRINLVIGFNYVIKDNYIIGAEILWI